MINQFNTLLVTMFGLGKIKKIPGTFGSLATILILYTFFHILRIPSNIIRVWQNDDENNLFNNLLAQ